MPPLEIVREGKLFYGKETQCSPCAARVNPQEYDCDFPNCSVFMEEFAFKEEADQFQLMLEQAGYLIEVKL